MMMLTHSVAVMPCPVEDCFQVVATSGDFRHPSTTPALEIPRRPLPKIRVNDPLGDAGEIGRMLAALGGVPSPGRHRTYQFPSESARAVALDEVRSRHGWTSVDPTS
jgi:hypothetical protein